MEELVQDSAASPRALISTPELPPLLATQVSLSGSTHGWIFISQSSFPLRPNCLFCRALLKVGALNKLGLI